MALCSFHWNTPINSGCVREWGDCCWVTVHRHETKSWSTRRQISPSYVCNGNVSSVWMKGFRSHKKSNTTVEKKTWFHSISLTEFGQISLFCRRNINEEEAFTAQHKFLVYYRFTVVRDTMFCPNKCNIIITDLFCYVIEDGVCSLYRRESSWCFLFIVSQKILPNLFIS